MKETNKFTFEISLAVLNHLGRNLYRSFATILGEAISNSWDADAKNVWIYVNKEKNSFFIKDNGDGMTSDDFQKKFLKIGYSKRKKYGNVSKKGRPYIGRKGIGKLALLSCADKITIISKTKGGKYIGGQIDNSGLDDAIKKDLTPQGYTLSRYDFKVFEKLTENHEKGTIIYFENIKEKIKNTFIFLRKIIALYFRFSLIDPSFSIYLNDKKITLDDIKDLAEKTEFLWNINNLNDPYMKSLVNLKENKVIKMNGKVKGFIASVERPRDLKIIATDERVGIDLFVNGRLRDKNILRHIPTARIAENYLYGQIHFNDLDDNKDRFTTSREGITNNDERFKEFLGNLNEVISVILEDWDKWRVKNRKDGDPENKRIPLKERKAGELFNVISNYYVIPKDTKYPEIKKKVNAWVDNLGGDAKYNFVSYAECFVSENLIRKHVEEKKIPISTEANDIVKRWRKKEIENKKRGNISINLRQKDNDLSYLDMDSLAKLVDPQRGHAFGLTNDAKQYKSIRDALMHTALLTNEAKLKLTSVYENIKGRVKILLSNK